MRPRKICLTDVSVEWDACGDDFVLRCDGLEIGRISHADAHRAIASGQKPIQLIIDRLDAIGWTLGATPKPTESRR